MHIEKNVFENIFNTVMDVKGKTEDNIKARLDIALFCNRKNIELVFDGSGVAKWRTCFVLEKNAQIPVYKWFKSLRFSGGHTSNISRLIIIKECRLYGMKSHDWHMFMQTLIQLAYRDLLPQGIWDGHTEISHFFRDMLLPNFWPMFLINFQKKPKNSKKTMKPPKKCIFDIFASFLAFSTSSQKNLNFQRGLNAFNF